MGQEGERRGSVRSLSRLGTDRDISLNTAALKKKDSLTRIAWFKLSFPSILKRGCDLLILKYNNTVKLCNLVAVALVPYFLVVFALKPLFSVNHMALSVRFCQT